MADKSSATVVISANEQERVEKLGRAFRAQLTTWMSGELSAACLEMAIVAFLSSKNEIKDSEELIEVRAKAIFDKLMVVLEAEVAR